jgi:hypothetical protein
MPNFSDSSSATQAGEALRVAHDQQLFREYLTRLPGSFGDRRRGKQGLRHSSRFSSSGNPLQPPRL